MIGALSTPDWRLLVPKLPRTWIRRSVNILATRDGNLYIVITVNPGQTVERVRFSYRIFGRWSESTLADRFDPYYVGIQFVDANLVLAANEAWQARNTADWMWWEGAHPKVVMGAGSPGQSWLFYPAVGIERDVHAKRLNNTAGPYSVVFSFAQSGGTALTDCRVNVVASTLLLG
jgi:hypothetical protein